MIDPADAYYFSRDFPEYDEDYEDLEEESEEEDEHPRIQ